MHAKSLENICWLNYSKMFFFLSLFLDLHCLAGLIKVDVFSNYLFYLLYCIVYNILTQRFVKRKNWVRERERERERMATEQTNLNTERRDREEWQIGRACREEWQIGRTERSDRYEGQRGVTNRKGMQGGVTNRKDIEEWQIRGTERSDK